MKIKYILNGKEIEPPKGFVPIEVEILFEEYADKSRPVPIYTKLTDYRYPAMRPIRIYQDGEKVLAGAYVNFNMKMIVVSAEETLKGWRYRLAFQKIDGTQNKKMNHRFFYADNLKKYFEPLKIK